MRYGLLAVLIGVAALGGCSEGELDPKGSIADADWQILLNSLGIMLAIMIPVIVATLGVAFWSRASNTGTDIAAIVHGQRAEASLQTVQAELAHVARAMTLGQLTASIAHEVNQPIGSARNNARAAINFLDRNPPDLTEVKEALGCIVADADRAGGIIDRIRDQIKKVPPRSNLFDLNGAIEEVIALAQVKMTESRVSIRTRLASGMTPVLGDRVQLQQVVLNLILNAVEAMRLVDEDERELLISTEQSDANGTLVGLQDSGPGIDPEHLEQIFEAFYTTKSGTGMGLSICRSIIGAHGGQLWATAAAPKGALFQFTLPQLPERTH